MSTQADYIITLSILTTSEIQLDCDGRWMEAAEVHREKPLRADEAGPRGYRQDVGNRRPGNAILFAGAQGILSGNGYSAEERKDA